MSAPLQQDLPESLQQLLEQLRQLNRQRLEQGFEFTSTNVREALDLMTRRFVTRAVDIGLVRDTPVAIVQRGRDELPGRLGVQPAELLHSALTRVWPRRTQLAPQLVERLAAGGQREEPEQDPRHRSVDRAAREGLRSNSGNHGRSTTSSPLDVLTASPPAAPSRKKNW